MICLIQRVRSSQLHIEGALHAEIGQGLLALVGLEKDDNETTLAKILDSSMPIACFRTPKVR